MITEPWRNKSKRPADRSTEPTATAERTERGRPRFKEPNRRTARCTMLGGCGLLTRTDTGCRVCAKPCALSSPRFTRAGLTQRPRGGAAPSIDAHRTPPSRPLCLCPPRLLQLLAPNESERGASRSPPASSGPSSITTKLFSRTALSPLPQRRPRPRSWAIPRASHLLRPATRPFPVLTHPQQSGQSYLCAAQIGLSTPDS